MPQVGFVKCSKEELEKNVPVDKRIKVEEMWLTEDGKIYFVKEEISALEKLRRKLKTEKRPL